MQKYHTYPTFSFGLLLAGILSLSGVFFTYAYAQDTIPVNPTEETVVEVEEVTIETSAVSEALNFIAKHGSEEVAFDNNTEEHNGLSDETVSDTDVEHNTKRTSTHHGHMSYEPHDPTCPVSEGQTLRPITLVISKIVCAEEADLPNWGHGGPDITANTASDFLSAHPSCHAVSHWGFQWGNQSVTNPGDDFLWDVGGTGGWSILGFTDSNGTLSKEVTLPSGTTEVRVREMLEPGYLPFSYGANGNTNVDNVSAELYCANDVLNYDNFDFVRNPVGGQTYHCVAWNVRKSAVNTPPIITLIGATPITLTVGEVFVDQGATSTDAEDGVLTPVITGSVNTGIVGTYTIRYTATDSGGLSVFVERTVNVVPVGPKPVCADGIDNDNDGLTDFPLDLGCVSATDTDENDAPVITVLGANPMTLVLGASFSDPGATSTDKEDGILIPVATGTVTTTATGTYSIIYTATDSKGLTATATRTVNVIPQGASFACSDGIDNDADGAIDFPLDAGCTSATDNDENNAPVITLIGGSPVTVVIGNTYTEQGATAQDAEDGNITANITATGTVNTTTLGTYTIAYNVSDSDGLSAVEVIRTVNVVPASTGGGGGTPGGTTPPKCSNGADDDNDGKADYPQDPGCTDSLDNDETDTPTATGGGGTGLGGGVGTPGLQIFNERLTVVSPTSVKITWNTNLLANSRVVYGDLSKSTPEAAPQYGYQNTTATNTVATSSHEMTVSGLPENSVMFFRPVSSDTINTVVGIELVTPVVAGSCTYLEKYLRIGYQNDPVEVTKLQRFLKEYEGFTNLAVTGFFDIETDKAVRAFQDKYGADILTPWALPSNTGYVYYTTKKKVNEIYCQRAFPLDSAQLMEIDAYAKMMRLALGETSNTSASIAGIPVTVPTVTVTPNPTRPVTPVIDLSKIDLYEMAPETPVTTLVPEITPAEGEIASGISTDIANGEKRWNLSLRDLLASLSFGSKDSEDASTTPVKEENLVTASGTTPVDNESSMVVSSFTASIATALGISTGALWVWLILFVVILILGYIMARKNRRYS